MATSHHRRGLYGEAATRTSSHLGQYSSSPGYFKTMGIPMLAGRDFTDRDERTAPPPQGTPDFRVAIVNERFARHYFGDAEPDRPPHRLRRQSQYADADRDRRRRARLEVHRRPRRHAAPGLLPVPRSLAPQLASPSTCARSRPARGDLQRRPADRRRARSRTSPCTARARSKARWRCRSAASAWSRR